MFPYRGLQPRFGPENEPVTRTGVGHRPKHMTSPKDDRSAAPVHFLRRRPVKLRRDVEGRGGAPGPKNPLCTRATS